MAISTGVSHVRVIVDCDLAFKEYLDLEKVLPAMVDKKIVPKKIGKAFLKDESSKALFVDFLRTLSLEKFGVFLALVRSVEEEKEESPIMKLLSFNLKKMKLQEGSDIQRVVSDFMKVADEMPTSTQERGFISGTTTKVDTFVGSAPTKSAALTNIGRQGSSFSGMSTKAKSSVGVKMSDEAQGALKDVRSDKNDTNWCAIGYEGNNPKNKLVLLGSGQGSVEDIREFCKDDNAIYGLFRVTDVVDDIPTVKFAFIQWVGESLKPMAKAKISTYKGTMEEIFKPAHVTIFATSSSEINQRVVMDKVMAASGSKSYVK